MEMEELKKEAKNSTTKANLLEDENRKMEEENIALKKLNTAMKEEIRMMKEENRLSLFLTDSHGKIIDFQKIEEELGGTLVRGKAYNSATWPFSKFPGKKSKTCARRQDEDTIY